MSLLRNFATVGVATLASRVLGFVRDMAMATLLGAGPVADAFFVALRLPNLFRRLFAEGAFNAAFVPLFSRSLEENGRDGARRFAEEVLSGLLLVLVLVTAVAEIATPALVYLLAPGFAADPDKFDLTTLLTRITFPYLLCMSLTAMIAGMLNAFGRFALAAFAASLLNVALIAVLILIALDDAGGTERAGIWLAWGVFAAGFMQLGALFVGLRFSGLRLRLRRPRWTPGVRKLVRLGVPGLIAGGIVQINIVVGQIVASAQEGAVSVLAYADRLYQLPLGVVGIAIGVVLLPELTRQLRSARPEMAHPTQNRSFEFAMALTLPAAAALVVIAGPLVSVIFERGAFTAAAARETSGALAAYALGLPAFVLVKVFQPGFFAREDTRTPMIHAGIAMAVNVAGAIVLFPVLGATGIAAATSLAGWINALMLGGVLASRGHFRSDRSLERALPMQALASAVMGVALWAGAEALAPQLAANGLTPFVALAGLVAMGLAVYAVAGQLAGAFDMRQWRAILRRRPQQPDGA